MVQEIKKKTFLIHSLAVYGKNKQKYGKNYFYDLKAVKKFFKLNFYQAEIYNMERKPYFFLSTNKK